MKESSLTKASKAPARLVCGGVIGFVTWRDAVQQDRRQQELHTPKPMSVVEALMAKQQTGKIPAKL